MLTKKEQIAKRLFDVSLAVLGLIIFFIPIVILIFLATLFTGKMGLFRQERVGQNAKLFLINKVRTMRSEGKHMESYPFGKLLRSTKLDELPQLYNVLVGDMSFVGPRPDVKGYADQLKGEDRIILSVRPGITGPATLKYRNEEDILDQQPNPQQYNDSVIWKDKVKINKAYIDDWSLLSDLNYIIKTIFS